MARNRRPLPPSLHAYPCASCGHRDRHFPNVGCTHDPDVKTPSCACEKYAEPDAEAKRQHDEAAKAEGLQAGREGADAALHGYAMTATQDGEAWRKAADKRVLELIEAGDPFTADDITRVTGPAPSRNALGGLFHAYKGRIHVVGHDTSTRPEARGRIVRVWQAS